VEGRTFHQAIQIIAARHGYDHSEQELREERGNVAKILLYLLFRAICVRYPKGIIIVDKIVQAHSIQIQPA
jgi:hypothetical protein